MRNSALSCVLVRTLLAAGIWMMILVPSRTKCRPSSPTTNVACFALIRFVEIVEPGLDEILEVLVFLEGFRRFAQAARSWLLIGEWLRRLSFDRVLHLLRSGHGDGFLVADLGSRKSGNGTVNGCRSTFVCHA